MESATLLQCPCGVPAGPDLPPPGARPAPCVACDTPLVRPGGLDGASIERAFAGAIVAAAVCAVAWMALVRASGDPTPIAVAVAGVVIGLSAWAAARVRGTGVQTAAGVGVVVFLLLGEFLIYRQALEPWLVRLHQAENAPDAYPRAEEELEDMDLGKFVHLASTLPIFVGLGLAFAGALVVTRAPQAVAAFETSRARPPPRPPAPAAEPAAPQVRAEETP